MSEWWAKHKAKIWATLIGVVATCGLVAATLGCNRLPPGFRDVCLAGARELADGARQAAPTSSTSPSSAELEVCPGGIDGEYCTSAGTQARPLPDGGVCRCR